MGMTNEQARLWARAKCGAWNWNANVAEIARELIDEEVEKDSGPFVTLGEEFVQFFGSAGYAERQDAERNWEIIGQIMDEFA